MVGDCQEGFSTHLSGLVLTFPDYFLFEGDLNKCGDEGDLGVPVPIAGKDLYKVSSCSVVATTYKAESLHQRAQ